MPNWAYTSITFYSKNEKQIKKFFNEIKKISESTPAQENSWDGMWLGNFVAHYLGKKKIKDFLCRGSITDIDEEISNFQGYYTFKLYEETAWAPSVSLWSHILHKKFPDIELSYVGEESGMEVYVKWDDVGLYPANYILNMWFTQENINRYNLYDDFVTKYLPTLPDVISYLNKQFGLIMSDDLSIEQIEQKINEILKSKDDDECDDGIRIYEYALVPPEEES